MIDKREIGGEPPVSDGDAILASVASNPPDTKKPKTETRDVAILPNAWRCPFCGRDNGIPEIAVCKCGARREGTIATK